MHVTAACAEMDDALTLAFRIVALSHVQVADAFVDHVTAEAAVAEASPPTRSLPNKGRAHSLNSSRES